MRLTTHTDYGLRLLVMSLEAGPGTLSIGNLATRMRVSRHHLMKVAQSLARAGLIVPVRGRAGGFRLAKPPEEIRVGEAVRSLESDLGLVECMRTVDSDCPLVPDCRLPRLFREATEAFLGVLDRTTLSDLAMSRPDLVRLSEGR